MRARVRSRLAALLVSVGMCVAATAHAAGERVVIIAEDVGAPLVQKLRSELTHGGYEVDVVSTAAGVDFSAEAALRHSRIVLRVSPTGDSIDLWSAEREGQSVRFRERIASKSEDEDASVLAIRAQEAVHGKLLPITPSESPLPTTAPPPREAPPPRPAPALPRTTPLFAASLGPDVSFAPGGLGAAGGAALGISWLATPRFSVDGLARIPLVAARVDAPEGTARVSIAAAGAGASFAFAPPDALVRPIIGAGLALGWAHVDGVANATFLGHSADLFVLMPYLRFAASVRLTSALRLRADFLTAVGAPSQAITFAGREVATFGAPLLDAALALEVTW